jgi:phage terminase small subunit
VAGEEDRPLTELQQRFVNEYLIDFNGTEAYKRAGYTVRNDNVAAVEAVRLLRNPKIRAQLTKAQSEQQERTNITADMVIQEEVGIGTSDIGDFLDFDGTTYRLKPPNQVPERARRAISSIKVKRQVVGSGDQAQEVEVIEFRFWPKNDALAKLGEHLGLWGKGKLDKPPPGAGGDAPSVDWSKATPEELELIRDILRRIAGRTAQPEAALPG